MNINYHKKPPLVNSFPRKVFCNKGIQTEIGTVKRLGYEEKATTSSFFQPLIDSIRMFNPVFMQENNQTKNRTILILSNTTTIHLSSPTDLSTFTNQVVAATGEYNSCSGDLEVKTNEAIEVLK